MSTRVWISAVALLCAAPAATAETLYVIEQLIVSVNAQPDGSGERIGQIKSGDRVELLERQDDQAKVRLASGAEGWVKASYLSPALPLQQQLNARNEELERIRREKAELEAALAAARRDLAAAAERSRSAPPPSGATAAEDGAMPDRIEHPAAQGASEPTESPVTSRPPLFGPRLRLTARPSWLWTGAAALIALAVGFSLGWRVLDRRIRAKYGGLRIY